MRRAASQTFRIPSHLSSRTYTPNMVALSLFVALPLLGAVTAAPAPIFESEDRHWPHHHHHHHGSGTGASSGEPTFTQFPTIPPSPFPTDVSTTVLPTGTTITDSGTPIGTSMTIVTGTSVRHSQVDQSKRGTDDEGLGPVLGGPAPRPHRHYNGQRDDDGH